MLRTKKADRIVCVTTVLMLLISVCMWGQVEPVRGDGSHTVGYEGLLFDKGAVHTIEITMEDWDGFIATATAEEYVECDIVIDGERYSNVGIRAKGNTSLSSVASLGSTRYSFKVEFNHYVKGRTYHGLDKLSLNNLIQDATMMKDYLAYTLMNRMDVPSSLCSYVQITVNGEPWGLYLAVEGVEDGFTDRNGMTKGELYKPDSLSFGGGRGNGRDFDMEAFREKDDEGSDNPQTTESPAATETPEQTSSFGGSSGMPADGQDGTFQMPEGDFAGSDGGSAQDNPFGAGTGDQGGFGPSSGDAQGNPSFDPADGTSGSATEEGREGRGFDFGGFGGFNFGMGNDDVKLVYSDDDPDSYSNIFDNAKTKISARDKTRLIESLRKLNAREDLDSVVDRDEVIRYLAVHNFLCNDDSYTGMMVHNYYLYEENGKLSIIPWDYNLGFGGFAASADATSTVNSPIDSPVSSGTTDSRPLIAWIFSDEESLSAYHEAYDRFISENIENGWLEGEIERVREMITSYLEKDESAFYDMEAFEKAVDTLKVFCEKRGESIRGQLDGTIPSTTQGQRADSAALVDASEISTADMGSMNSTGGGGMGGGMPGGMPEGGMPEGFSFQEGAPEMPGQGTGDDFGGSAGSSGESAQTPVPAQDEFPAETALPEQTERTEQTSEPSLTDAPEIRGEWSGRMEGFPGGNFPGTYQASRSSQWIWLAACSVFLLLAILVIRRAASHNS